MYNGTEQVSNVLRMLLESKVLNKEEGKFKYGNSGRKKQPPGLELYVLFSANS